MELDLVKGGLNRGEKKQGCVRESRMLKSIFYTENWPSRSPGGQHAT